MGILDDLAMGFGMKERTADYDARTARTIAVNDATRNISNDFERTKIQTQLRNDPNFDYRNYTRRTPTGYDTGYSPSRQYLDRAGARGGYDAGGYNPSIVEDNRPFMQRALYSPESTPSPSPYAIGPMQMDQPLPAFGVMGLIKALAGGRRAKKEAAPMSAFDSTYSMGSLIPRMSEAEGEFTEEEIADITEAPENEFAGMNSMDIKDALMAKFSETGEDPTLDYTEELFGADDTYVNYLNSRPMEDKITAYANRLAGR